MVTLSFDLKIHLELHIIMSVQFGQCLPGVIFPSFYVESFSFFTFSFIACKQHILFFFLKKIYYDKCKNLHLSQMRFLYLYLPFYFALFLLPLFVSFSPSLLSFGQNTSFLLHSSSIFSLGIEFIFFYHIDDHILSLACVVAVKMSSVSQTVVPLKGLFSLVAFKTFPFLVLHCHYKVFRSTFQKFCPA